MLEHMEDASCTETRMSSSARVLLLYVLAAVLVQPQEVACAFFQPEEFAGWASRRLLAPAAVPAPAAATPAPSVSEGPAMAPGSPVLLAALIPFPFCYKSESDGYFRPSRQCLFPSIPPQGVPPNSNYTRACCQDDPGSGKTNTCFYWDIATQGVNCTIKGQQWYASCCVYPPPTLAPPPPPLAASSGGGTSMGAIIGGIVGGCAAALVALGAAIWCCIARRRHNAALRAGVLGLGTVRSSSFEFKDADEKEWRLEEGEGSGTFDVIRTDSDKPKAGAEGRGSGMSSGSGGALTPYERNQNLLSDAALKPEDIKLEIKRNGKLKLLGRGAFGEVYVARWHQTRVAVKVLLEQDEAQQHQFCAEANLLRSLRHPNIVLFLGACLQIGKKMMVVTELCEGGDLATALSRDVTVPRRLGWYLRGHAILLNVACGLAYLHSRSICHYDIKPGNVLLDKARMQAKISDVGLSKVILGSQASQATLRGTFQYMAPELMTYEHGITFAVDIYSFGVMMHEVITGEPPDKRRGSLAMPRVPEDCPQAAVDLYLQCTQRDPSARPTSSELVTALEAIQPLPHEGPRRVATAPVDATSGLVSVSAISQQRATVDMPGFGVGTRPSPIKEQGASVRRGLPDQAPGASEESTGRSGPEVLSVGSTAGRSSGDGEAGTGTVTPSVVSQGTGVGSLEESGVSQGTHSGRGGQAGRGSPFEDPALQGRSYRGTRSPGRSTQGSRKMPSAAASDVEMMPSPFQAMGAAGGASWVNGPPTGGSPREPGVAGHLVSPFDNSGAWPAGDAPSPQGDPAPTQESVAGKGAKVNTSPSSSSRLLKTSPPTPTAPLPSPYLAQAQQDW